MLSSSETFALEGWSFHKNGCDSFEYQIDGGEWLPLQTLRKGMLNTFYADVPTPAAGTHAVTVRGILPEGESYTVAEFQIAVKAADASFTGILSNLAATGISVFRERYTGKRIRLRTLPRRCFLIRAGP